MLFHSDGRTGTPDISGDGQKLFHRDHIATFIAGHFSSKLQVHFLISWNYTNKISRFITVKYEGFKNLINILSQTCRYMHGTQIAFVYLVRNKFIGNLGLIQ